MNQLNPSDPNLFIHKHLISYTPFDNTEEKHQKEIINLINTDPDYLKENNYKGHLTGTAYIISPDFNLILLNHHKTLDRWLHFGGHTDEDPNMFNVALREAIEETGLKSLKFVKEQSGIFDIDVHTIPLRQNKYPKHKHYDISILLSADPEEKIKISNESVKIEWILAEKIPEYNSSEQFKRVLKKIQKLRANKFE